MTSLGPLVHRSARVAGALFLVGVLQFLIAIAVEVVLWPSTHVATGPFATYQPVTNYISDLGNSNYNTLSWLFNASIILLGLLGLAAVVLVRSAFQSRRSTVLGLGFLGVAVLGAILVGTFPEPSPYLGGNIHSLVSLVTFIGSGFALLFLGLAMLRDTRWEGLRGLTVLLGLITLVALAAYIPWGVNVADHGLAEWLVVGPILLWGIVAGAHLLRLPTYAPSKLPVHPTS